MMVGASGDAIGTHTPSQGYRSFDIPFLHTDITLRVSTLCTTSEHGGMPLQFKYDRSFSK